jgi:hypothetical protein
LAKLKRGIEKGEEQSKIAEYVKLPVNRVRHELKTDYESKMNEMKKNHTTEMEKCDEEHMRNFDEQKRIRKEAESLKGDVKKINAEKKAADWTAKLLKISVILTAAFVIVDVIVFMTYFSQFGASLLTILAPEVAVVLGLPAFLKNFKPNSSAAP